MQNAAPSASADPLTGLQGHAQFTRVLDAAIAGASAEQRRQLWVGVVCMPRLSYINAGFGTTAGDDVIRGVARNLRDEFPDAFALARLEGAELAGASFGSPRRSSQRHHDSPIHFLGLSVPSAGAPLFTTLLAGQAHYADGDDGESLLRKARLALARAGLEGRSDHAIYDDELGRQAAERAAIARDLPVAIEGGQLRLHFQPKIELASRRLTGAEALVRWPLPDGGMVSPARFVPAAEASGMIMPLGDWVLREVVRQADEWRRRGLAPLHVAANVSALQFQKTDIVMRVGELLRQAELPPQWLELELTEGALMADADEMVARLAALRDMGVELAIDDFGTGFSSLSYLKRFPVQRLKIDQSFVRDCHENAADRAIVRSVITLGHNLGLKVIAEGAETEAHVDFLTAEGCDEVQGYCFSRPLDAAALEKFVASWRV